MKASTRLFVVLGFAVAVALAAAVSPYASSSPDGLEKVADQEMFLDAGELARIQEDSPIPDYAFPGVEDERVATGLAGFVGTLFVFVLGYGIAFLLRGRDDEGDDSPAHRPPADAAGA